MPNRIIKESICVSDTIAGLSWFDQCLFFRLIVLADDYGRFDARPLIIKGKGFPLVTVTDKQIANGLSNLATAGIVNLYNVGGKPYLQLKTWDKHQSVRAKKSKYPAPDDNLQTDVINCNQLQANVPVIQSVSESLSVSESEYENTPAKPPKHRYGEYKHVLLTDDEYAKLQERYADLDTKITALDRGIENKGYKYKSHYLTIIQWADRDAKQDSGNMFLDMLEGGK